MSAPVLRDIVTVAPYGCGGARVAIDRVLFDVDAPPSGAASSVYVSARLERREAWRFFFSLVRVLLRRRRC